MSVDGVTSFVLTILGLSGFLYTGELLDQGGRDHFAGVVAIVSCLLLFGGVALGITRIKNLRN